MYYILLLSFTNFSISLHKPLPDRDTPTGKYVYYFYMTQVTRKFSMLKSKFCFCIEFSYVSVNENTLIDVTSTKYLSIMFLAFILT